MINKQDRLNAIQQLIHDGTVQTQGALLAALKKNGMGITQSTLSRDLAELGVCKDNGRYVFANHQREEPTKIDYSEVVRDWAPCGPHLIVVKTVVGQAQPVALFIDQAHDPAFVATLAGDDVIFIATRNRRTQVVGLRRLNQWFGGQIE